MWTCFSGHCTSRQGETSITGITSTLVGNCRGGGKDDWLYSQKVKELNMYFIKVAYLD